MAKKILAVGDSGETLVADFNDNCTEIYNALPQIGGATFPVNVDAATSAQKNAAEFSFGGNKRVNIGQQKVGDQCAGSGIVESIAPDGTKMQMTHYQYGVAFRGTGVFGNQIEMWLGDAGLSAPNLSVRHNGNNLGARIQARNAGDTSGLMMDFVDPLRPKLILEPNFVSTNAILAFENSESNGSYAFATKVGAGALTDKFKIANSGVVTMVASEYADNAAALTAGLVAGQIYRTGDLLKIVH